MNGSIYCITNSINNHKYIGKTLHTIEQRFQEHIQDSKRTTNISSRPLYNAFNKYGIEHFIIELVEECNCNILSDRDLLDKCL